MTRQVKTLTERMTHRGRRIRTPAQLLYNVYATDALPNLATQFLNGVVVDLESQHPGLVISEVMWGEDASLNPSTSSQYIELYNPGAQYKTVDDADHTPAVNEALTLIFYAPNEFSAVPAKVAASGNRYYSRQYGIASGLLTGSVRLMLLVHTGRLHPKVKMVVRVYLLRDWRRERGTNR